MKKIGTIIYDSIKEISSDTKKYVRSIKVKKRDGKFYAIVEYAKNDDSSPKSVEFECDSKMKDLEGGEFISRNTFMVFDRKNESMIKTYCYGKTIYEEDNNVEFLIENGIMFYPCTEFLECSIRLFLNPIIKDDKIGFVNALAEIVYFPEFDEYDGLIYDNDCTYDQDILVRKGDKWGVISYKSSLDGINPYLLDIEYDRIWRSKIYNKESRLYRVYTVQKDNQYAVYLLNGEEIVRFKEYEWISGFDSYLAIVKRGNLYGLINVYGDIVLPIEFDKIQDFYGKSLEGTRVYKNGKSNFVKFSKLVPDEPDYDHWYDPDDPYYQDYYYPENDAYDSPYYNDALDFDQQEPEFWENL